MALLDPHRAGFRWLACVLVLSTTFVFTLPPRGWAMLAPASTPSDARAAGVDRAADMKTISTALESKIVRQRLKEFGLNEQQVNSRLDKLSDKEVHQLASQIHTLNPGGDFTLVGLLFLVLIVVLIVYLVKRI